MALAQPRSIDAPDTVPLTDYLGLLERIAPAARQGAEAYLAAYERRCGRTVATAELRAAISQGSGDPTLMAMIRASQLRDATSLAELSQKVSCKDRK